MMDNVTFSDQEIEEELSRLGYTNIPRDKLREFQRDLNHLVQAERSKGNSQDNSFASVGNSPREAGLRRSNGIADPYSELGAVGGPSTSSGLRREDLDRLDERTRDVRFEKPTVPPHFALYELPHRTQPDIPDDVSETASEIRRMKRKTLRKNEEGAKYIDETMSDIDAGHTVACMNCNCVDSCVCGCENGKPGTAPITSVIDTHERMERMLLRDLGPVGSRRTQSARSRFDPPPYRLNPDDPRPPSVIYGPMEHPHTKNLHKTDPVNRYHQMQNVWAMQKAPGETSHKTLRWNVREQMLTQYVPERKPQRKYVPNKYVPPPMKRRDALRWQVRLDIATGNMPITAYNG